LPDLDWGALYRFLLLWLFVVPTPGPNSLMVVHTALTHRPRHLPVAISANVVGVLFWATCAAFGLTVMLDAAPAMRKLIHFLGGAYLVYFAFRLLRRSWLVAPSEVPASRAANSRQGLQIESGSRLNHLRIPFALRSPFTWVRRRHANLAKRVLAPDECPEDASDAMLDPPLARSFSVGLATALSNAQAIFFMTSIYAVTGITNANTATALATLVIIAVCNGVYLLALGWLLRRSTPRIIYARHRRWLERLTGLAFLIFGSRLMLRELSSSQS
jgi:threonine/homoserine/homoserine lactone efflux protein